MNEEFEAFNSDHYEEFDNDPSAKNLDEWLQVTGKETQDFVIQEAVELLEEKGITLSDIPVEMVKVLIESYVYSGENHGDFFADIFTQIGQAKCYEASPLPADLKDITVIYHGRASKEKYAARAWSLDKKIAEKFSTSVMVYGKTMFNQAKGKVYELPVTGTELEQACWFYTDGREEKEVYNPQGLSIN